MLIVHGTYFLARKLVAYRNDYCLSCNAERMAFQRRTFDVHHIFYVPLLPLGFWKRWHCSACDRNPHESPRILRRSFKWAGIVLLVVASLSGWLVSTREKPGDTIVIWCMRLGGPIAVAWALWATLKSPPDVRLSD